MTLGKSPVWVNVCESFKNVYECGSSHQYWHIYHSVFYVCIWCLMKIWPNCKWLQMIIIEMRGTRNMVLEAFVCVCMRFCDCECACVCVCECAYWRWSVWGAYAPETFLRHIYYLFVVMRPSRSIFTISAPSPARRFIISFYFIFILWLIFISIQINPHSLSCLLSSRSFLTSDSLSLSPPVTLFTASILLYTKLFFSQCRCRRYCCRCILVLAFHQEHWKHFMKYDPTIMTKTNHFENDQLDHLICVFEWVRTRERERESEWCERMNVGYGCNVMKLNKRWDSELCSSGSSMSMTYFIY